MYPEFAFIPGQRLRGLFFDNFHFDRDPVNPGRHDRLPVLKSEDVIPQPQILVTNVIMRFKKLVRL